MARTKSTTVSSKAPSQPTVAEIKEWYASNKDRLNLITNFADNDKLIKQLRDITKSYTKTVTTFDKTKLRQYLQNIGWHFSVNGLGLTHQLFHLKSSSYLVGARLIFTILLVGLVQQ